MKVNLSGVNPKVREEEVPDFQYDNYGITFKNGIDLVFGIYDNDINIDTIKFPNGKSVIFTYDENGNFDSVLEGNE